MNILSFFRILFLTSFKFRNKDPRDISLWRAEGGVSVEINPTRYAIDFSVPEIENGYLLRSPPFVLRPGVHEISLNVATTKGACSLGVLDVRQDNWIASRAIDASDRQFHVVVPVTRKTLVELIVSAGNVAGAGPISATLSSVELETHGDRAAAETIILQRSERAELARWRREVQPRILLENLEAEIARQVAEPSNGYGIVGAVEIGYAARSITTLTRGDRLYVFVANAGDDSVTVLERAHPGASLVWKCDLLFPEFSTPIDVQAIQTKTETVLGVSFFHMQDVASHFGMTGFGTIPLDLILDRSKSNSAIRIDKAEIRILFSRSGIQGARNSAFLDGGKLGRWIAVADRDASLIALLYQSSDDVEWRLPAVLIPLEDGFEPVGISGHIQGNNAVFYSASRLSPKLAQVVCGADNQTHAVSMTDIGGLSRSSIAIGTFGKNKEMGLAVGLWGGDPRNVTTPYQGAVFYADINENGDLVNHAWFDAGINTTDVVAGDLDGDGIDELAVLNYGNGLNLDERSHLGDLQLFKKISGEFQHIATLDLPTPRIGLVTDYDGDGKLELGITLFHEKRLIIARHFK